MNFGEHSPGHERPRWDFLEPADCAEHAGRRRAWDRRRGEQPRGEKPQESAFPPRLQMAEGPLLQVCGAEKACTAEGGGRDLLPETRTAQAGGDDGPRSQPGFRNAVKRGRIGPARDSG